MIKNHKLDKSLTNKGGLVVSANAVTMKELYGEVFTPFHFIDQMLDIIPEKVFENPNFKWLDPGTGTGNFSVILYFKLLEHLKTDYPDIEERKDHIIKNMIYMVELQSDNVTYLKKLFGPDANIYEGDFLDYSPEIAKFDVIIGNPPFNSNGLKKVPTNSKNDKKQDGQTVWSQFIRKSIDLLKSQTGLLCVFIPSIWLKPDKQKMYYFLTQYDIKKLNCFSNTETNQIFKGNAQTPSCFFLLTKRESNKIISIKNNTNLYIDYYLYPNAPIPLTNIEIINKLKIKGSSPLEVIKTNMPPKGTILSPIKTEETPYPNITTCLQNKKGTISLAVDESFGVCNSISEGYGGIPHLVINYSNIPLYGANKPKLILAHKMYGLPYLDKTGEFGISNRDNYVIYKEKIEDLIKLQKFLSTKLVRRVFDATRYRMKYLEKYAFQLIPDITKLPDFPEEINDETVNQYISFQDIVID